MPKLSAYCRIMLWIEEQDANLAWAIRNLCLEGLLAPGRKPVRGKPAGVTFLMPSKDVRKAILKEAESAAPEKAVEIIKAHIIPAALLKAEDFTAQKLATRGDFELPVKGAKGGKVELEGGVELSPADFRAVKDKEGRLAVWTVTKGAVPTAGKPFSISDFSKGGSKVGGGADSADREEFLCEMRRYLATNAKSLEDCTRVAMGYLHGLLNHLHKNYRDELRALLPLLDYSPIASLYIFVSATSDAAFGNWDRKPRDASTSEMAGLELEIFSDPAKFAGQLGEPLTGALLTNPKAVFEARVKIIEANRESGMIRFDALARQYKNALGRNRIGAVNDVWPEATLKKMQKEVGGVPSAMLYDCVRRVVWTLSKCLDGRHSAEAKQEATHVFLCTAIDVLCGRAEKILRDHSLPCDMFYSSAYLYGLTPWEDVRSVPDSPDSDTTPWQRAINIHEKIEHGVIEKLASQSNVAGLERFTHMSAE